MRVPRPSLLSILAFTTLLVATMPKSGRGQTPGPDRTQASDSAAAVATVGAFHRALADGDSAAVRELLADDVVVAESGGLETREEYLAGHMGADMGFAAAVAREPRVVRVAVAGDAAWVVSASRTTGTFGGRAVDSRGAELMVLSRDGGRWRIRAIHWSSRQAR